VHVTAKLTVLPGFSSLIEQLSCLNLSTFIVSF
jgi:hypothetical protein